MKTQQLHSKFKLYLLNTATFDSSSKVSKVRPVSDTNLISNLIANAHLAQIIHQDGLLIYANTAAARIFGFDTISAFAKFAKDTQLFAKAALTSSSTTTSKILTFRRANGDQKRAHVKERGIDWNGTASTYLQLELLLETTAETGTHHDLDDNETFVLNTMSSAMDWGRLDIGDYEIVRQPFDFASVSFQLCNDLTTYAEERGVELTVEVTPRAQKIFKGDAPKFARAASCMVRHAINRVLGGRVDVLLRTDERGQNIMFEVCDNGMAYKPVDANLLFEIPRETRLQSDPTLVSAELNLPLARCIARHLGGEVGLKVNHGSGGLVRMRLPFPEVIQDAHTLRCTGQKFRKLDILVVEDNQTSQHVIKVILETLGHRATVASNGSECLDILRQANFDLILMDLHMPVKDGYSTTEAIRARENSGVLLYDKPIPILAVTADRRQETRNRALAAGVSGFLTKPVHVPQIMSALVPYIAAAGDPLLGRPQLRLASRGA
jgi:CheY-like chemotaxis protein